MGTERQHAPQPAVTTAPLFKDDAAEGPQQEGPTDAVFTTGWAPKGKQAPPSQASAKQQKAAGVRESAEAADAAVAALAGRLDAAATLIDKIVSAPADAAGPGIRTSMIDTELGRVARGHEFLHVAKVLATQHEASDGALALLVSSESRLDAAVARAEAFAKANSQSLNVTARYAVRNQIDPILATKGVERSALPIVGPSSDSSADLAVVAVHEQLDAALARVEFLRVGIDVAQASELHAAIEEYTAHMKAAQMSAGVIVNDRMTARTPKASRTTTAKVKKLMGKLTRTVRQLQVETAGNVNAKAQTKWSDLSSTLAGTKPLVMKL